jgi:hypothetical protein
MTNRVRIVFFILCCLPTIATALPVIDANENYLGASAHVEIPSLNGYYSYDVYSYATGDLNDGVLEGAFAKVKIDMNYPQTVEASAYTSAIIDNEANTFGLNTWASAYGNMFFEVSLQKKDGSKDDLDELVPIFADWFVYSEIKVDPNDSRHYGRSLASVSISNAYGGISSTVEDFTGSGAYDSGESKLFLSTNAPLQVNLTAFTDSRLQSFYPIDSSGISGKTLAPWAGGYALADPTFYIDPTWEFANLYELSFDMNLKDEFEAKRGDVAFPEFNSVQVPEPTPFALFAISLAILSLFRRSFLTIT